MVEKYAYDPWGARRNPTDWTQKDTRTSFITNRGYTGHEHLEAFGIINMNGRVYDPLTAMFFSPDPFIQAPGNWLNYNRYGYCMNNPTGYIDPSGYQATIQTENGNNSMWSAFQQMAQTESRLGISDGSIGGSTFGSGFTGYSFSDAYLEARSEGFKGTYSDFITISLTQMSRASFNGKVVVHTWYNYNDDEGAVAKKTGTIEVRLGNGNNSIINNLSDISGFYGSLATATELDWKLMSKVSKNQYLYNLQKSLKGPGVRNLTKDLEAGINGSFKSLNAKLGIASGLLVATNIAINQEIRPSDAMNVLMIGVTFTPFAPIASVYFVADMAFDISGWMDNKYEPLYDFKK